jgi:hypothetical protein
MNFGISDKIYTFAIDSRQESLCIKDMTAIFMLLHDVSYLTNKLLKSLRIAVCLCTQLVLGGIREASSFLYLLTFQIHTQMPRANESEVQVQSVPTSQTKSQSKLEKEIISIQKKVSKLQEECRHERNEKYRLLCYIHQYCSALFPYFDRSNPVDSKNWERVHRLQLDLDKEIK